MNVVAAATVASGVATIVAAAVGAGAAAVGVATAWATARGSGSRAFISTTPARMPMPSAATPASPDQAGTGNVRRGAGASTGAATGAVAAAGNGTRVPARRAPQLRQ